LSLPRLPDAPLLALRNAQVFSPDALGIRHLLLGGGKILWIGKHWQDMPADLGVDMLDLDGRRLIPGLIDGHVHVTGGGGEAGFRSRVPGLGLSHYSAHGITTVIGLLGTDTVARGPRDLLAAMYALREEGLSAFGYLGGYHLPAATLTGSVRSDLVFLEPLIGVGELAISDHRSSQPTLDELLRVASDAHVAGLMTGKAGIVHLHLGDGERGLDLVHRALTQSELPARVFQPTHVNRRRALFDEAVALSRRGVPMDVTAFPVEEGEDAWTAADAFIRWRDAGAPMDRLTISSDAGGSLPCFDAHGQVCGMDVGTPGALLATLAELLERGVPLDTALPAFTANVATALRLPHKGRIGIGMDADLVCLDENHRTLHVIARGRLHRRDGHNRIVGTFERISR
jgi:beta-aspartyl-dipeptidase (metallo-type)